MLQDKKVFLNNNHSFSNVDFHAETMACVRERAADNEILLMFHNHKDRLRCKWERALDSFVRARCDAQVGLSAATTLHRCLAVSFSCSQSLRNCSSHICLAWAAQYVTLSTSNESAAHPEIRARGQTCPISRHACLKGIGLPGHRFQNLGGRDDTLFLEEGKKQVSLSSVPSHHNGITLLQAQILAEAACNLYGCCQNTSQGCPAISVAQQSIVLTAAAHLLSSLRTTVTHAVPMLLQSSLGHSSAGQPQPCWPLHPAYRN